MSRIFSRIFRYRQTEHRTASEDYFTETFVAVLDRYESLRTAFVAWLTGIDRVNIRSVRIETQTSFNVPRDGARRRPDVWVEVRDAADGLHVAIIENKIDSDEGENQLSDYAGILEGKAGVKSRTLVYITKYSAEPDFQGGEKICFKHRKWFEVYGHLREQQNTAEGCGDLLGELLKLMEDWNMDGTLNAARLRAAIVCIGGGVGNRLHDILNEAWQDSGITDILEGMWEYNRWTYGYAEQKSPPIQDYRIRLWSGFRFDRRDADWDVNKLELPSPVVTVFPRGEGNRQLPKPSENWSGPVQGMSPSDLWVRQPVPGTMPRHGDQLDEYYKAFFFDAYTELKIAFELGQ